MREMGIKACYIKPWTKTTISKDFSTNLKNILKRDFNPKGPDDVRIKTVPGKWKNQQSCGTMS